MMKSSVPRNRTWGAGVHPMASSASVKDSSTPSTSRGKPPTTNASSSQTSAAAPTSTNSKRLLVTVLLEEKKVRRLISKNSCFISYIFQHCAERCDFNRAWLRKKYYYVRHFGWGSPSPSLLPGQHYLVSLLYEEAFRWPSRRSPVNNASLTWQSMVCRGLFVIVLERFGKPLNVTSLICYKNSFTWRGNCNVCLFVVEMLEGRVMFNHLYYHYSGASGFLQILYSFASLPNYKTNLMAGHHHLKVPRVSTSHAMIHGHSTRQPTVVTSLIGNNLRDGRFRSSEKTSFMKLVKRNTIERTVRKWPLHRQSKFPEPSFELNLRNGLRRSPDGALPLGHPLAIRGHLNLAAGLHLCTQKRIQNEWMLLKWWLATHLEARDLLPSSSDDESDHLVGNRNRLRAHVGHGQVGVGLHHAAHGVAFKRCGQI